MLTIKKSKIYSDKKPEELISRLNWKTYHVNKVLFAETNNSDTNKPLTGKVDEKEKIFKITRLRSGFQKFIPQLTVNGEIKDNGENSVLRLKYQLGLYTTAAIFIFIATTTALYILQFITDLNELEITEEDFLWILIYPIIAIILTFWELNKTKEILYEILEIKD